MITNNLVSANGLSCYQLFWQMYGYKFATCKLHESHQKETENNLKRRTVEPRLLYISSSSIAVGLANIFTWRDYTFDLQGPIKFSMDDLTATSGILSKMLNASNNE